MKKIMLVFGTRPEAIKMCPLVKEFQKNPKDFETIVCVTGQHREMLDQVLRIFEVTPDYDLNIMQQGQDLYDVTARVLTGMRDVFKECKPDVVLVHGDTTTSTAAALAAFYQQIPVGHVEAGLRTHTYNFSPTPLSECNLKEEKAQGQIYVTGNTVIDALHMVVGKLKTDKALADEQIQVLKEAGYDVERLGVKGLKGSRAGRKLVLITGHRRENFGEGFISMVTAMKDLSEKYPDVDFVYPMHLNPNVRKPIHEVFGEDLTVYKNFFFIEPLQYLEFVYLMEKSTVVLTDSGGIQEEAPGYFNACREYCEQMGADWRKVHTGVLLSGYINDTHTYVPGPDGKFGYGGKCFPKDVNAFAKMTEGTPLGTLLEHLHELNVHFRGVEEHI